MALLIVTKSNVNITSTIIFIILIMKTNTSDNQHHKIFNQNDKIKNHHYYSDYGYDALPYR